MLMSNIVWNALEACGRGSHVQKRYKKYMPFYLNLKKRTTPMRKDAGSTSNVAGDHASHVTDSSTVDVVSRLASPHEALEILRSIQCSFSANDIVSETFLFRLWSRLDIRRVALRGISMLPHPVGPKPRVVAICEDEEVPLALECGATYAGLDNILERIAGGWTNFDCCVTTTVHMPKLVKVARILGPKKLMPNMKEGTLSSNLLDAVRRLSSSRSVQFRALCINSDDYKMINTILSKRMKTFELEEEQIGVIEVPIATREAMPNEVIENAKTFIRDVMRQRPNVAIKTIEDEFRWPPVKKNMNTILEDVFSSFTTTEQQNNQFIIASAFGLGRKGASITNPIMVDPADLM